MDTTWLILTTKPCSEHKALDQIRAQGYEAWLPLSGLQRKVFPRGSEAEPLWPGYIWAAADEGQPIAPLYHTIGVRRPIMAGDGPKLLSVAAMERIRRLAEQISIHIDEISRNGRMLMLGQILRVIDGPFDGKEGLCIEDDGGRMVTIGVELMGRQVPLQVPLKSIQVDNASPSGTGCSPIAAAQGQPVAVR